MEYANKTVLIFAGPEFEDSELTYPYYRFLEGGADVQVAGLGDKEYKGKKGFIIETDGRYEDFVSQSFDLVVIPGGWMPDKVRMNEAALEIVRKACKAGSIVAAICHGGWILASAEVVNGKKVTSYQAIKDDLIHAGGKWQDAEVLVDGNIVTSRTPDDLPAFCREIGKLLVRSKVPA